MPKKEALHDTEKQLNLKDSFKGENYLNGVTGTNLLEL